MLEVSQKRLYELNRETDPPEIAVISPIPVKDTVEIKGDKTTLLSPDRLKIRAGLNHLRLIMIVLSLSKKTGKMIFLQISMLPALIKLLFLQSTIMIIKGY